MHLHLKHRAIEGLLGFEFAEGALEFHGPRWMNGNVAGKRMDCEWVVADIEYSGMHGSISII